MKLAPKIQKRLAPLAEAAQKEGVPLYIVGGAVRDALLGRRKVSSLDIDLVVEEDPRRIARAFTRKWGGVYEAFGRFGTARVVLGDGFRVDIARARTETYAYPGALPAVSPATLAEDLKRRDFTVNAMALRVADGRVVDLHDGRKDLEAGRLRILHPESFIDDPTRMFRAARYAGRLGFYLEKETVRRLKAAVRGGGVKRVSRERIRQELMRILAEKDPRPALALLKRWGLLGEFHPAFRLPTGAADVHDAAVRLGLAALTMGEKAGGELLASLPLASAEGKALKAALQTAAVKQSPAAELPELARRVLAAKYPCLPKSAFAPRLIGGRDLQAAGIAPGKRYAEVLARAAKAQWRGAFTTRAQAKRWFNRLMKNPARA